MSSPAPFAIAVVPMRRRHLRAVVAIEAMVNPKPWSLSLFQGEIVLTSTRTYVVAISGREVVGFAGLMMAVDDGHITTIAVAPEWQRCGIATQLIGVLSRTAIDKGATALTLEVRLGNRAAQELYRRFSFAPVGARRSYYDSPVEDALIMWAHDIRQPEFAKLLDALETRVRSHHDCGSRRDVFARRTWGPPGDDFVDEPFAR